MRTKVFVLSILIWMVMVANLYASIMDPPLGTRAGGMGNAVVGLADDLFSALYYNPAGLNQIKGRVLVFDSCLPNNRFRYEGSGPFDGYHKVNSANAYIPSFGYSVNEEGKLALALGAYSTLGTGFKFRGDSAHGVTGDFESKSGIMSINPTVSYQLDPKLAVGIQLNIGYGKSHIAMPTPLGYLEVDTDGFGLGGTIGLLYKPLPSLSIGLRWRSSMKTPQEGDADLETADDSVDLDYYWPQMIDLGVGFRFGERLTVGANVKWSDWSYFGRSKFKFKESTDLNGPFTSDIRDGIRWGIGMEYCPRDWLALRFGYHQDSYSVKSESISPLLPEMSFSNVIIGLGMKWENIEIDTVYGYCFTRHRTGNGDFPGKYEVSALGRCWDNLPFQAVRDSDKEIPKGRLRWIRDKGRLTLPCTCQECTGLTLTSDRKPRIRDQIIRLISQDTPRKILEIAKQPNQGGVTHET